MCTQTKQIYWDNGIFCVSRQNAILELPPIEYLFGRNIYWNVFDTFFCQSEWNQLRMKFAAHTKINAIIITQQIKN